MATRENKIDIQPELEGDSEDSTDQAELKTDSPPWGSITDHFLNFLKEHPFLSTMGGIAIMGDLFASSIIKKTENHQYEMPTSVLWGFLHETILGEDYYRAIWRKWAKGRSSRSVGISRPNLPSILLLDTLQNPSSAKATIKEFITEFRKAVFDPEQTGILFLDLINHPKWKTKFGLVLPEGEISACIVHTREASRLEKMDQEIWDRTNGVYGEPLTKKFYVENMEIKRGLDASRFIPMVFDEKDIKDQTLSQVYHSVIRRRGLRVGDQCNTLVLKFPAQSEEKFFVDDKTITRLQDIASTGNIYFTKFPSCPREDFVTSVHKFLSEFELALKNEPPTSTLADFFNTPAIREMFKLPDGCDFHVEFYDGRSYRLLGQILCSEVPLREFGYFYGNHNYIIHIFDPSNPDLVQLVNFLLQGKWALLQKYSRYLSNSQKGVKITVEDEFPNYAYRILTEYIYEHVLKPFLIGNFKKSEPERDGITPPEDFQTFISRFPSLEDMMNADGVDEEQKAAFSQAYLSLLKSLPLTINGYFYQKILQPLIQMIMEATGFQPADLKGVENYKKFQEALDRRQKSLKDLDFRQFEGWGDDIKINLRYILPSYWEIILHFLSQDDVDKTPNAPLLGPQLFLEKIQQNKYTQEDPLRNVNEFDMINILLRDAFDRARRENAKGVPQAGCRYCESKHDVEFHHIWPHAGIRLVGEHTQILEPLVPNQKAAEFQAAFDLPYRGPSEIWNIVGVCRAKHHPTGDILTYLAYPDDTLQIAAANDPSIETVYNLLPYYLRDPKVQKIFDYNLLNTDENKVLTIDGNNEIKYSKGKGKKLEELPNSDLKLNHTQKKEK